MVFFNKLLPAIAKPTYGLGVASVIDEASESESAGEDELVMLHLRDRGIGGSSGPLSTDVVELLNGESLIFRLPMDHIMLAEIIVTGVTSTMKFGGGVLVDVVRVLDTKLDIVGRIRTTDSPSRSSMGAIRFSLSNGDRWEVNVPILVSGNDNGGGVVIVDDDDDDDDDVVPYSIPYSVVSDYVDRIADNAEYLHGVYYDTMGSSTAIYAALNYDAIYCYREVSRRLSVSHYAAAVKSNAMAQKIWSEAGSYWLPSTATPGYYLYNRGPAELGLAGNADAYQAALNIAYLGAGSRTSGFDHIDWDTYEPVQTGAGSREFALSLISHMEVWDFTTPVEWESAVAKRDEFVRLSATVFSLGVYIPLWLNSPVDDWPLMNDDYRLSQGLLRLDWAPFMFAHTARMLIRLMDDGHAATWGITSEIENALVDLAEFCWVHAWVESGGYKGFFYRPLVDHNAGPSVDLNMFIFPWYAWVADHVGTTTWYERCQDILEGGNDSGSHLGLKQFDQNTIWTFEGLDRLGWI